jgi:quinol-cytochrome oxidoreductase complex cytochrome b subunit
MVRYEALTDPSIKIYPFLARFKPFFFVFIILFIVAIFVVTIIGYYLVFEITTPVIVIYLIVSVAFLIFYIVTVIKIGNKVKQASTLRFETKQHVLGVSTTPNILSAL